MSKPQCAKCVTKYCKQGLDDKKNLPAFCPMVHFKSLIKETAEKYSDPSVADFFKISALTEKESYDS